MTDNAAGFLGLVNGGAVAVYGGSCGLSGATAV